MKIRYTSFPAAIGKVYIAATENGLFSLSWGHRSEKEFVRELKSQNRKAEIFVKDDICFKTIKKDILKYLSGKPVSFHKYKVHFSGTDFQKEVWHVLSKIPYGRTLTYKQVAEKIGKPWASRAVGGACGANELPIIVPCHRVIASSGSLGGFSGGLKLKRFLLRLEGVVC